VRGAYIGDAAEPPDELRRDLRALLDAPRKE
jgi:hypothetical protein